MLPATEVLELRALALRRTAEGDRCAEAAALILDRAQLLGRLQAAVCVHGDGAVTVDWVRALALAERLPDDRRGLVWAAAGLAAMSGADAGQMALVLEAARHALDG